ncbi:MAG TPA: tetratricopeptide repeat protein, partial [Myxococcota bacterium]|nr:tetratricopeptide repeat protein [Myxococcota bacterium]
YAHMSIDERDGLDDADVFGLADWLTEQGRMEPALAILQRYISTHPTGTGLARAHLRAGFLLWKGMGRPAAAVQHLLSVLDLRPEPEVAAAARQALEEIHLERS